MTDAPAPLTPPECDLRDFSYMPVDIGRLFSSEFHALADDTAWRAGVTLWLKGFHQVPAASLPDDDVQLARAAELGRDVKAWRKIRAAALHGWKKCSDGRLYHPVVAEKALEAWIEKLRQRKSSAAGNAKRYGHSYDEGAHDAAIESAYGMLGTLNPNSRSLRLRTAIRTPVDSPGLLPVGDQAGVPPGSQGNLIEGNIRDKAAGAFALEAPKPKTPAPQIPDWIPEKAWAAFVESRKKLRKPLTAHAIDLAIRELSALRDKGHDPQQVIDLAVLKGWLSFYAPKDSVNGSGNGQALAPPAADMQQPGEAREHFIVRRFKESGTKKFWLSTDGPPPSDPDCGIAKSILAEFGYAAKPLPQPAPQG